MAGPAYGVLSDVNPKLGLSERRKAFKPISFLVTSPVSDISSISSGEEIKKLDLSQIKTIKELGVTNFSRVVLIEEKDGRKMVLKTFKPNISFEKIKYEHQMLSNMEHQNISRCDPHIYLNDDGSYSIKMDYIEGKALKDIDKEILELYIQNILVSVFRALDYLETQKTVHRDLHPGNILFNETTQEACLIDFGIAKKDGVDDLFDKQGGIVQYRTTPESIKEPNKANPQSNMWALGIMLFSLYLEKSIYDCLKDDSIKDQGGADLGEARVTWELQSLDKASLADDVGATEEIINISNPKVQAIIGRCLI